MIGKRNLLKMSTLALSAMAAMTMTGCGGPTVYTVTSGFYWSADGGATYKSGSKEYYVGENVYMQLIVRINSDSSDHDPIGATLQIPYIKDVVSKYYDGQVITPTVDEFNHVTTYNFTIIATEDAPETKFVFKFIPIQAAEITIRLTFDDNISESYDKQNTIAFYNAPETTTSEE